MGDAKKHSKLGASSSHRWWHCPGSVRLSQGIPNVDSPYAREGSCAHAVAEFCLNNGQDAVTMIDRKVEGFEDIEVTEEMADAVQVYLDAVRADMARYPDAELAVETRFDLSHIHPEMFGTNDASVYVPSEGLLIVYDYKHGKGIPVEVEANPQMLYYGTGALTGKHNRPIQRIQLVIAQPRCPHPGGPIRRWDTEPLALLDWIADLQDAAKRTEEINPYFEAGDWCKFCPAAGICDTLQARALEIARADFAMDGSVIVSKPESYAPEALAKALGMLDVLENWARSVRAFAHVEAENGRIPPGWKLVPRRSTRKWKSEDRLVEEMLDYGFSRQAITTPGKLMSPAQLEAFLKTKGIKKEQITDLWHSPPNGAVLAPADDKRDAVRPEAAQEFM